MSQPRLHCRSELCPVVRQALELAANCIPCAARAAAGMSKMTPAPLPAEKRQDARGKLLVCGRERQLAVTTSLQVSPLCASVKQMWLMHSLAQGSLRMHCMRSSCVLHSQLSCGGKRFLAWDQPTQLHNSQLIIAFDSKRKLAVRYSHSMSRYTRVQHDNCFPAVACV